MTLSIHVAAFVESYQGKQAIDSTVYGQGSPFYLGTKRRYRASGIFTFSIPTPPARRKLSILQQTLRGFKFGVKAMRSMQIAESIKVW